MRASRDDYLARMRALRVASVHHSAERLYEIRIMRRPRRGFLCRQLLLRDSCHPSSRGGGLRCSVEVVEVLLDLSPGHRHQAVLRAPGVEEGDGLVG